MNIIKINIFFLLFFIITSKSIPIISVRFPSKVFKPKTKIEKERIEKERIEKERIEKERIENERKIIIKYLIPISGKEIMMDFYSGRF